MSVVHDDSSPNQTDDEPANASGAAGIDRVSIETGIQKETLRAWERRYAFPKPKRNSAGDRAYSQLDIDKLKALKRLVDHGYRPRGIVDKPLHELHSLLAELRPKAANPEQQERLQLLLELIKRHDAAALQRALRARFRDLGLEQFVLQTVVPLVGTVGALWAIGEIEVFEEHLTSELVQSTLHDALQMFSDAIGSPSIVLATPPNEHHQIGLLMAQALFALEDARCINLGAQVPPRELVKAVIANDIDVAAISIAPSFSMKSASKYIAELDGALPAAVEVWFGGNTARDLRNVPSRVRALPSLTDIRPTLQSWRAGRPMQRTAPPDP